MSRLCCILLLRVEHHTLIPHCSAALCTRLHWACVGTSRIETRREHTGGHTFFSSSTRCRIREFVMRSYMAETPFRWREARSEDGSC